MIGSLLPNILADPGWSVVAAADADGGARLRFASRFPGIPVFQSSEELIGAARDRTLNAIFIAVDPAGNVALAGEAIAAGLHVFVEKPCGGSAAQLRPLVVSAESRRLIVMVGTMWRYAKAARLMRDFLVSVPGQTRRVDTLAIHACFPTLFRRNNWEPDDKKLAFFDMFIHPIDFACWFLRAPLEVRAVQARQFDGGNGAVIVIMRSQQTGQTANLHLICGSQSYSVDIAASCADGTLARIRDLSELDIVTFPAWTNTEAGLRDRPRMAWSHGPLYRGFGRHGYAEEIEAFRLAIVDGRPVSSPLAESLYTMRTMEAALTSLDSDAMAAVDIEAFHLTTDQHPSVEPEPDLVTEVIECIASTIGISVTELGDDPQFGWPPLWDSLSHMNLMVALELKYDVHIADRDVQELTSPLAIAAFLTHARRRAHT